MVEDSERISILKGERFTLDADCYVVWGQSDTTALPETFETFKDKLIIPEEEPGKK